MQNSKRTLKNLPCSSNVSQKLHAARKWLAFAVQARISLNRPFLFLSIIPKTSKRHSGRELPPSHLGDDEK